MHYIGQIQYWANAIRPYNYTPIYPYGRIVFALLHTPYRIHPKLHYYIITTLHVIFCAYIPKNAIFGNK